MNYIILTILLSGMLLFNPFKKETNCESLSGNNIIIPNIIIPNIKASNIIAPNITSQKIITPNQINHPKAAAIQAIMDEYTKKGVPGVSVAIKDDQGIWEGASGYAKIEVNQKLSPGLVHPAASVTKTYIATATMKLLESGLLNLDSSITKYLPGAITSKISNANGITVRMLLNHTSGIPDYINNLNFKFYRFNNLSTGWTVEKALSYVYHKPILFTPGSDFSYSNNNYILLSLLIENVTNVKEGIWLEKNLFEPLALGHTYYKSQPQYLDSLRMVDFYMDRYGDGRLENVTIPSKNEIESELGDGGLVATSVDFVIFLDALMNKKIISQSSLDQMKQFGSKSEYGLGLETGFNYQNKTQYGHQGAVFGGYSLLLYFEEQKTSFFISINADASLVGGKTLMLCHEMKNKIANYLASF